MVAVVLREAFIQKSPFPPLLSAHSVSEWTSDASSVADRDDRQQPLMESVCDNGLVKDIHMASLIQYVESGHVQL